MVRPKRARDSEDESQAYFSAPAKPFAQRIEEANEAHRSDSSALLSSNAPIKPTQLKATINDAVYAEMLKFRNEIQPFLKLTDKRFQDQEGRLEDQEGRLEDLEARIEDLEACIEEQKLQLEEQGDRLEKQDEKIEELESEASNLDARLHSQVVIQDYCTEIQNERIGEVECDVRRVEDRQRRHEKARLGCQLGKLETNVDEIDSERVAINPLEVKGSFPKAKKQMLPNSHHNGRQSR